jgi:hypothetical protein
MAMARQVATDAGNVYLVEHYRPGLQVGGLRRLAALVRAALDEFENEARGVRFVRTTIVPADESLLCIVEAETEELCPRRTAEPASRSNGSRSCSLRRHGHRRATSLSSPVRP